MEAKNILLLLILPYAIFARPQEGEIKDVCEVYPGYKCLEFEECETDVVPETLDFESTILNRIFGNGTEITEIDTTKSPCESPKEICCKPKTDESSFVGNGK